MNTNTDLLSAIRNEDLDAVIDYTAELEDSLWSARLEAEPADYAQKLLLATQEMGQTKLRFPDIQRRWEYHLGRKDGYLEALERLARWEEHERAAEEVLKPSPAAMQVLEYLREHGSVRHGELAKGLGKSDSALSNLMKNLLRTRTVQATQFGRIKVYQLTDLGQRCCRKRAEMGAADFKAELLQLIQEAFRENVQRQAEQQTVKRGDTVMLRMDGVMQDDSWEISSILSSQQVKFVDVISNQNHTENNWEASPLPCAVCA
ncbi:MAG: hypothetical protein IKS66_01210 [Oscillospiraceae bacterium]|nr:hypothetical protein [Oscillospiraceae bacterium]